MKRYTLQLSVKNFIKVLKTKSSILFVPKCIALPENISIDSLESWGIPYIYLYRDEYARIYSGIVTPIKIFYHINSNGEVIVSDDISVLLGQLKSIRLDERALIEFLAFGYTLGDKTLFRRIRFLEAGQVLEYSNGEFTIKDSFIYDITVHESRNLSDLSVREWTEFLWDESLHIFKDLTRAIMNKTVVVPLSSGFDSRFEVVMLKLLGVKNVLCLNYGIRNSWEKNVSQKVAEKLDYEWIFIEYTASKFLNIIRKYWFHDYILQASNFLTTPNLQELLSTYEFKNYHLHQKQREVVFIPGHNGGFVSGGHVRYDVLLAKNLSSLVNIILKHHYIRKLPVPPLVARITCSYVLGLINRLSSLGYRKVDLYRIYEIFDWRERQSKYIISSTKPYEFFGFKYALPLWDKRFVELWNSVPLKWRYRKRLYRFFLSRIFSYFDLDFERKPFRYLCETLLSKPTIDTLLSIGFSSFMRLRLKKWYNPCGFNVFFPPITRVFKGHGNAIEYFKKLLGLKSATRYYAHICDLTLNILSIVNSC